jgi:glycerol-3-phosphate dehydrogenase
LSKEVHLTKNQVIWAVREEMAMTVEDVLARRTRVLFLNASESLILAPTVAAIMGKEMGKDSSWITTQIENYTTLTQNYLMK